MRSRSRSSAAHGPTISPNVILAKGQRKRADRAELHYMQHRALPSRHIIADAQTRVQATRAMLVTRWHDEGIAALAKPFDGLALARRKLAEAALQELEEVVMIGDTMETDIRGAVEAGMHAYLVLTGSTQIEGVGDYVYQPTRLLQSVADLTEEIKTGRVDATGA